MTDWRYRERGKLTKEQYTASYRTQTYLPWTNLLSNSRNVSLGTIQRMFYEKSTGPFRLGKDFVMHPVRIARLSNECSHGDLTYDTPITGRTDLPFRKLSGEWFAGNFTTVDDLGAFPTCSDAAVNTACTRMFGKINEPIVDGALFLAELDQAATLLFNPVKALKNGLQSFLQRKSRGGSPRRKRSPPPLSKRAKQAGFKLSDGISNKWLEYQFGLIPLISDVQSGLKYFDAVSSGIQPVFDRTAAKEVQFEKTGNSRNQYPIRDQTGWFQFYINNWTVETGACYASAYWIRKYEHYSTGGGLYDIPSFIWERTPFSFVVDWIVDVGGYLRAIQPNDSVTLLGTSVSHKFEYMKMHQLVGGYEANIGKDINPTNAVFRSRYESINRGAAPPMPLKPALTREALNLTKKLDSLALIWQKMPRRF